MSCKSFLWPVHAVCVMDGVKGAVLPHFCQQREQCMEVIFAFEKKLKVYKINKIEDLHSAVKVRI